MLSNAGKMNFKNINKEQVLANNISLALKPRAVCHCEQGFQNNIPPDFHYFHVIDKNRSNIKRKLIY
jgi:hypothetical protein